MRSCDFISVSFTAISIPLVLSIYGILEQIMFLQHVRRLTQIRSEPERPLAVPWRSGSCASVNTHSFYANRGGGETVNPPHIFLSVLCRGPSKLTTPAKSETCTEIAGGTSASGRSGTGAHGRGRCCSRPPTMRSDHFRRQYQARRHCAFPATPTARADPDTLESTPAQPTFADLQPWRCSDWHWYRWQSTPGPREWAVDRLSEELGGDHYMFNYV